MRAQLAKLTRPRLHNAVARERLFTRLDVHRRERQAICIVGPPGAGKTTLAASWLDARGVRGIWYQVDGGDADAATFFHYLGIAATSLGHKGQRSLPALTPEYLADLAGFARRFFRELFARLPEGACLVLDNYQEVAAEHVFHEIVAEAVAETPEGLTLLVLSRRDPPDCYARLTANNAVAFVDWEELRLTVEEAQAIAAARSLNDRDRVRALHARTEGWAAGLTLLLQESFNGADPTRPAERSRDTLFGYFAAQAFHRVTPPTQQFLMQTALLPSVPVSIAAALTGNGQAAEILDDLYRRRLFTHRRPGPEPTYWYHALFRGFLREQAERTLPEAQRRAVAARAGELLLDSGLYEDAFALLCEAQDWSAASRLVIARAESLLAAGRWQTLRDWILRLPAACLQETPWLGYWLGVSLLAVDQVEARVPLQQSFQRFRSRGDSLGQLRAASSIMSTWFFEWSHWQPLDPWIEVVERLMADAPAYPSSAIELEVCCSMLVATLYRCPGHPLLARCADRVEQLLDGDLDVNRRVAGATVLLTFCNLAAQLARGERLVSATRPLLAHPDLTPLNRVWWYSRLSFFLCATGPYTAVEAHIQDALATIEGYGMKGLSGATTTLIAHLHWSKLCLRDWHRAQELADSMNATARATRPSEVWQARQARLRLSICRGQLDEAIAQAPATVDVAVSTGMVYLEVMARSYWAEAVAEAGRGPDTREQLRACRALVRDTCLSYWEPEFDIIEAYVARQEGDSATCRSLLEKGFAHARRVNALWRDGRIFGRLLAAMCAEALSAAIETEYVQGVIARFDLKPPLPSDDRWPWSIKVYTLGQFEILVEGKRLDFPHKAPRKQLLLLKALLALGARDVPARRVTDAVWPDEEGDAAWRSLSVGLARLRALLGRPDAIVMQDERISLNPDCCWWDVRAFEELDPSCQSDGAQRSILNLYRGAFLPAEVDHPWTVPLRERLRARFAGHLQQAAARLERAGAWTDAAAMYARGIDTDDLAEEFYRGLMRCHLAMGQTAEGLAVYRRLRQILSVVLGIAPAGASEALHRALREAGSAQRSVV